MLFSDPVELGPGLIHWPSRLGPDEQALLRDQIREIVRQAPLFAPSMPKTGAPFSVRMTNCGSLGWVSDINGYRYQPTHPETGIAWPTMPPMLVDLWREHAAYPHLPEACLVNFYEASARMGLHQDKDESDFDAPVLSISLGDDALFRFGGTNRRDPTRSLRLHSGDLLVMGGPARLCFHGVDRIYPDSSALLKQSGRINLTLRRVNAPA
jgi:DNA oxidative demethylase